MGMSPSLSVCWPVLPRPAVIKSTMGFPSTWGKWRAWLPSVTHNKKAVRLAWCRPVCCSFLVCPFVLAVSVGRDGHGVGAAGVVFGSAGDALDSAAQCRVQ